MLEYPFFDRPDLWPLEEEMIGVEYRPRKISSAKGVNFIASGCISAGESRFTSSPPGTSWGSGLLFRQGNGFFTIPGTSLYRPDLIPGAPSGRQDRYPNPGVYLR